MDPVKPSGCFCFPFGGAGGAAGGGKGRVEPVVVSTRSARSRASTKATKGVSTKSGIKSFLSKALTRNDSEESSVASFTDSVLNVQIKDDCSLVVIVSDEPDISVEQILITLKIKSVEHRLMKMNLRRVPGWLRKVSPEMGTFAFLWKPKDSDAAYTEACEPVAKTVLAFLEDHVSHPRLFIPSCRSETRTLGRQMLNTVQPAIEELLVTTNPARQDELREVCHKFIETLDTRIRDNSYGGPFLFGASPSVLDVILAPIARRFAFAVESRGLTLPDALTSYFLALFRHEAVEVALPSVTRLAKHYAALADEDPNNIRSLPRLQHFALSMHISSLSKRVKTMLLKEGTAGATGTFGGHAESKEDGAEESKEGQPSTAKSVEELVKFAVMTHTLLAGHFSSDIKAMFPQLELAREGSTALFVKSHINIITQSAQMLEAAKAVPGSVGESSRLMYLLRAFDTAVDKVQELVVESIEKEDTELYPTFASFPKSTIRTINRAFAISSDLAPKFWRDVTPFALSALSISQAEHYLREITQSLHHTDHSMAEIIQGIQNGPAMGSISFEHSRAICKQWRRKRASLDPRALVIDEAWHARLAGPGSRTIVAPASVEEEEKRQLGEGYASLHELGPDYRGPPRSLFSLPTEGIESTEVSSTD